MGDIPEPWHSAMLGAGITDPRSAKRPSLSELGRRVDAHTSTLSAMITGQRETRQEIVDKVAEALRVDPVTVAQWVGRARTEKLPYKPHPDADLMTDEERAAVNGIIGLFVKQRRGGSSVTTSEPQKKTPDPGGVYELRAAHTEKNARKDYDSED